MLRNVILGFAAAALVITPVQTIARGRDGSGLRIERAWVRATPNAAPTAAGYLIVTNTGRTADRLLGGTTPDAKAIEPHAMSMTGGIMRMRLLPAGFEIAPGATLTLSPMGNHLMLIAPIRRFKPGDRIPGTLRFAHAGPVKVEFAVMAEAPPGS